MHMGRWLCVGLLVCIFFAGVSALEFRNGGEVVVKEPINDDLFASGARVSVDAPVRSVVSAGGVVDINGPVAGDVIAAGGQVTVNGDVGGKIVAAGGRVTVNGKAQNLVAAGGTVTIGKGATIARDAALAGQRVINEGDVQGTLYTQSDGLINTGTVGKVVMPEKPEKQKGLPVLLILVTMGFLVLGCILIRLVPGPVRVVSDRVRQAPVMDFVYGVAGTLVLVVVTVIIGVTIIGLPIAIFMAMGIISVVLLAPIVVSMALGEWITALAKKQFSPYIVFILGFVILHLLFAIPFLIGIVIRVIATLIGIGAILVIGWIYWKNPGKSLDQPSPG
jgi:hypothetical protein